MKIVYNPPTGAPIKGFNFEGNVVELHDVKEVRKYEDLMADALVAVYPFMQIISENEAVNLEVSTEETVPNENPAEPPVYVAKKDRKLKDIPQGKIKKATRKGEEKGTEIPDDLKGADWYGEGPQEERSDK